MNHKYEIRQQPDGQYLLYEMNNLGPTYKAGPFASLEIAELAIKRLKNGRVWQYDDNGDPVE